MTKEECIAFVKKGSPRAQYLSAVFFSPPFVCAALAHAMYRDGSSGGVIRTVTIDATGVTRDFTPGNALPFM